MQTILTIVDKIFEHKNSMVRVLPAVIKKFISINKSLCFSASILSNIIEDAIFFFIFICTVRIIKKNNIPSFCLIYSSPNGATKRKKVVNSLKEYFFPNIRSVL